MNMPAIWPVILVFVAVLGAELLHARRVVRVRPLLFRASTFGQTAWLPVTLIALGLMRAAAIATMTWGCLALLAVKPADAKGNDAPDPKQFRRIVVLLDVSPSMAVRDAAGGATRAGRTAGVVDRAFASVDLKRSRVSVVAFYTSAKPVIVDTVDPEVVRNVLDGLPLTDAFEAGKTDLFAGLRGVFDLASAWDAKSADLIVLSDGDSVSTGGMPRKPSSIDRIFIAGVGDPRGGTPIDGHLSRQDASSLKQVATRLDAQYVDINAADLPVGIFGGLGGAMPTTPGPKVWDLRQIALAALAAGAAALLLLPVVTVGLDHWLSSVRLARQEGGAPCVAD